MAAGVRDVGGRDVLRSSGEPRLPASRRTDVVMTAVSLWFVLGLFLDAYAHANFPELETFFTPWHAVFYTGFAATAGWVLWTVTRQVKQGRRGLAAVPVGYGMTMVALPVFVASGAADMAWHALLGIETDNDIFFSPSHLGLIASMILIVTSPLRSAWAHPEPGSTPSLRALWPAVGTLAFAAALVLLFLTYANALVFRPSDIVDSFSGLEGRASALAARMVVTNLVLLAPLLVIARRWHLPPGAVTITYTAAALISAVLTGFENLPTVGAVVLAGVLVDVLAARLRPTAARRAAFWAFPAAASLVTWVLYLGAASAWVGRLPTIVELWTGAPLVAALLGWAFAVLLLPDASGTD